VQLRNGMADRLARAALGWMRAARTREVDLTNASRFIEDTETRRSFLTVVLSVPLCVSAG